MVFIHCIDFASFRNDQGKIRCGCEQMDTNIEQDYRTTKFHSFFCVMGVFFPSVFNLIVYPLKRILKRFTT